MILIRAQDGNSVNRKYAEFLQESRSDQKDIEKNQAVIVRRDTREKIIVSLDEIETKLGEVLEQMQNDMLERAKKTSGRTYSRG